MFRRISPSNNEHQWPRQEVPSIECRKRDIVIRISDWRQDRDAPGVDVEVYISGVYDWNESGNFPTKRAAAQFASAQLLKLLS